MNTYELEWWNKYDYPSHWEHWSSHGTEEELYEAFKKSIEQFPEKSFRGICNLLETP